MDAYLPMASNQHTASKEAGMDHLPTGLLDSGRQFSNSWPEEEFDLAKLTTFFLGEGGGTLLKKNV